MKLCHQSAPADCCAGFSALGSNRAFTGRETLLHLYSNPLHKGPIFIITNRYFSGQAKSVPENRKTGSFSVLEDFLFHRAFKTYCIVGNEVAFQNVLYFGEQDHFIGLFLLKTTDICSITTV
jgi:hypothetical protein